MPKMFGSQRTRHVLRQNHHWWRNMGPSLRAGEKTAEYGMETDNLMKGANITRFVKSRRIAWFGHVMRIPKRVMLWKPEGRRLRGKPRKRWIDGIGDDMKIMKIRGWHGRVTRWIKWRVCDVGEAKEGLEHELWRTWSNGRVGEWAVT